MTEGKEKERKGEKCTITTISVTCLLCIPVIDMSLGGGIWKVDEWSIYYESVAPVLMGSDDGIS